jgi:hypothetical protein
MHNYANLGLGFTIIPGEKVNILGGHTICHYKQKSVPLHVLFRTVSETVISLYSSKIVDNKHILRKR